MEVMIKVAKYQQDKIEAEQRKGVDFLGRHTNLDLSASMLRIITLVNRNIMYSYPNLRVDVGWNLLGRHTHLDLSTLILRIIVFINTMLYCFYYI